MPTPQAFPLGQWRRDQTIPRRRDLILRARNDDSDTTQQRFISSVCAGFLIQSIASRARRSPIETIACCGATDRARDRTID